MRETVIKKPPPESNGNNKPTKEELIRIFRKITKIEALEANEDLRNEVSDLKHKLSVYKKESKNPVRPSIIMAPKNQKLVTPHHNYSRNNKHRRTHKFLFVETPLYMASN